MARWLAATVVALLAAHAASCGPRRPAGPEAAAAVGRVAVLPFRVQGHLDPTGRFVADPSAREITEDLGRHVAERLTEELARLGESPVASVEALRATPVPGAALYDARLAARVARDLGADVAIMGAIGRYVQRRGSALSVESPASVEYQAMAVDAASGAVIGSYLFDFTQQPLAADLTTLPDFLQGGGKWRTREEILERSLPKTAAKIASALRGRRAAR